jgi:hypothetical protein
MDKVTRELSADEIFDRPCRGSLAHSAGENERTANTVGDVALQAMARIADLEADREQYRELLKIALERLATLTETCKRQREWNRQMAMVAEIVLREAA